jgi:hypothetical protein
MLLVVPEVLLVLVTLLQLLVVMVLSDLLQMLPEDLLNMVEVVEAGIIMLPLQEVEGVLYLVVEAAAAEGALLADRL